MKSARLLFSDKWLTRLRFCFLSAGLFIVLPASLSAATASEEILAGRASLAKQTPTDLQSALAHFNSALALDSTNLEANFLKAATLLVLEQSSAEFQQQLAAIGITVTDANIYNFEYQLPVDADGIFKPADGVMSDNTLNYLNTKVALLLDQALACLAKFGNDPTSRTFRIQLSAAETSLADVRIDYGDVLIMRSLLKGAKAALALFNSYNFSAEYALIYRLFKDGSLTPQRVLSELTNLLKFSASDQRAAAKSGIIAANADYQSGYAFTKSQRLPAGTTPYFFEFSQPRDADDFASELGVVVSNLAAGGETNLYKEFYPFFLRGLTIDTGKFFSSVSSLRSFVGSQFNQGFPTRNSWPDENFGGVLPESYSRGVLLDEFDLVMGQMVDTDGDGLSNSWERGYGRYEIVSGQFIQDWAASDAQWKGGHVATFTTQAEWDWFQNRYWREIKQPLYLGLISDGQQPANWSWITGENGSFRKWASGQPVDDSINVTAVLDSNLTWRSLPWYRGYYWDPMTWTSGYDFPPENIGYILERGYPTDPSKADTDSDGFNDKVETNIGTDPNNAATYPSGPDMDGDGVNNYRESIDQTDSLDPKSFNQLSVGLIACYPFTGDAKDESGFDRNGIAFNTSLAEDRFGLSGRAYSFDGTSSYVGTAVVPNSYGSAATFSAWFKIPFGYQGQGAAISQPNDAITTGLRIGTLNGALEGAIWTANSGWGPPVTTLLSPANVADGAWHHAAIVSEGWSTKLFLDGQEVSAAYTWSGGPSSREPVLIGKEFANFVAPYGEGFFVGNIDDVRIYNRALSISEVAELYSVESAPLVDTDGDGLPDIVETKTGIFVSRNNTGTDPRKADTDGDGLADGIETNTGFSISPTDTGSNPNSSDSNYDGITDGEAVVGGFDPSFNLATSIAWFAGLIQAQPGRFNLMTTDAIMDMNVGSLMIQRVGSNAVLKMQFQTSTNLATQPFANYGEPVTNSIPMPGSKGFIRLHISGQPMPTPAPTPVYP